MILDNKGFSLFERWRRLLTAVFSVSCAGIILLAGHARPTDERIVTALGVAGAVFVLAGVAGRVWCTAYIGGRKNAELVTKGPYSMTRNPLYFFSFIAGLGICFEFKNVYLIVIYITAFPVYYHYVIMSEEKRLGRLFGGAFEEFKRTTPAFFPNVTRLDLGELPDVSSKLIMRSMMDGMVFLIVLLAAYMFDRYQASGALSAILTGNG
jgi:protein-S-isoprenylcysteine O-methyltransferase Ste14